MQFRSRTSTKHPADFDSCDGSTGVAKQDFLTVLASVCLREKNQFLLRLLWWLLLAEGLQRFLVPDRLSLFLWTWA